LEGGVLAKKRKEREQESALNVRNGGIVLYKGENTSIRKRQGRGGFALPSLKEREKEKKAKKT